MKPILFLILAFFFFFEVSAQRDRTLDSLENVVEQIKDEKLKLKLYGDLSWGYGSVNFDKSLFYGKAELQLAEKLKDSVAIALAHSDIGNTYTRVNNLKEALVHHLKAYAIRDKLGLKIQAAGSISNIAIIYKQRGEYKEALDYMLRSLRIYEDTKDEPRQAVVLSNMGNVYMSYLKFDAAKSSYSRAITLANRTKSAATLATCYSGLFKYYFHKQDYESAIKHALIAEKYVKDLNMKTDLAAIYNNIGQAYEKMGSYKRAMKYFKQSLDFRLVMNDKLGIASCYKNMAATYINLKQYELAEKYLDKSIILFKALEAKDYLREAYDLLGILFEKQRDYENALKSFKGSVELKDSIYNKDVLAKINELQIAYETEKKTKEILLLNKENEITKLKLSKQSIYLGILAATLVIVVGVSYLFIKGLKLKQQTSLQREVIKQQDIATKAILQAEENERRRISGELHDGLGQLFSAVKMNLSALTEDITFKSKVSEETYDKTIDLVDESCREVRSISHQMAPNVLLKSGLASAVRDFINKIDSRKLKINLETVGLQERLDQNVETVLYRVIQEAVNNVIKHSGANMLDIQLIRDEDGVNAMIEDNGKGFDVALIEKFEGIGLKNIRTRVEYLKGSVDFSSQSEDGTLVAIHIPL